jgi:Nucleotide-diphospho-sugar transferase
MILNSEEVEEFFKKIAIKNPNTEGTLVFTNGNERYVSSVIKNLLESVKQRCISGLGDQTSSVSVFCSDQKAYDKAVELGMTACYVKIPSLGVDDAYNSAGAGSELYLRLCFVKIILIKYALKLGYDVLYIDPDMAFNQDCLRELLSIRAPLTFAKYIRTPDYVFVNSNIMRVWPTPETSEIFDFFVARDLQTYLNILPDVSDETFLTHRLVRAGYNAQSLNVSEYPSGADSKGISREKIKMFHANCIVGLENKIEYLRSNGVWFV